MNTRNIIFRMPALAAALGWQSRSSARASACAAANTPRVQPLDGLQDTQLTRVAQVCQNVMGLEPSERLPSGANGWATRVWITGPAVIVAA